MKQNTSFFIFLFFFTGAFLTPQEVQTTPSSKTVVMTISDGSEIIGKLISENSEEYTIKTPAGIEMKIPRSSVVNISDFEGKVEEGKIFHSDPNKSMYLFSPSAFPIGEGQRYCRDFCVFFPSINWGFGDRFSFQLGAFWSPALDISNMPLVGSIKITTLQNEKFALAGGMMYIRIPFEEGFGMGFTFITGTVGDRFTHGSLSFGYGFAQYEGDWEFMDRPIITVSGNLRMSNTIALVTENWFIPELDIKQTPLSASLRFFGRRIAVDVGVILILEILDEGLPIPILNFTYHFQ